MGEGSPWGGPATIARSWPRPWCPPALEPQLPSEAAGPSRPKRADVRAVPGCAEALPDVEAQGSSRAPLAAGTYPTGTYPPTPTQPLQTLGGDGEGLLLFLLLLLLLLYCV